MRIFTLSIVLLVLSCGSAFSQNISNYNFTASSGTFSALSGATATTGLGTGNVDEGYWTGIPIGFDFFYMGVRYTSISASTNGWLTFGTGVTDPAYANNLAAGGAVRPVLAPLWDDLNVVDGNNATY